MFDKSKDYLRQTVRTSLMYQRKTAEGADPGPATAINNCVHQTQLRTSPDYTQEDVSNVYIWREMWREAYADEKLPVLGDQLVVNGDRWIAMAVTYTDMDDSGFYQRYKLTCIRAKVRP